ncbi:hypothetical protein GcM1_184011, partial [Golovinomyces cichoracearum]
NEYERSKPQTPKKQSKEQRSDQLIIAICEPETRSNRPQNQSTMALEQPSNATTELVNPLSIELKNNLSDEDQKFAKESRKRNDSDISGRAFKKFCASPTAHLHFLRGKKEKIRTYQNEIPRKYVHFLLRF